MDEAGVGCCPCGVGRVVPMLASGLDWKSHLPQSSGPVLASEEGQKVPLHPPVESHPSRPCTTQANRRHMEEAGVQPVSAAQGKICYI